MDLNREYAAHQRALMRAGNAANGDDRLAHIAEAHSIGVRISAIQKELGAAAACAWSKAQFKAARYV